MKSELVTPAHLARRAVVYIRQSTPAQVVSNQESLRLQYALTGRARDLGWHAADVDVIDADLDQSGASLIGRDGFKDLAARVGLGEIGIVLSIDVTRLARNCSDWYPLLDVCALRGCLIADRDGVYDPGSANGRLLLGLKGSISELELHTIRSRLTAGLLAKAQRGDLALTLPVGLVRLPGDVVVLDPDEEVRGRLGLVFSTFARLRSAAAVMRDLAARGLDLPRRDRHGDLRWTRPTISAVTGILKNPAYGGAFVYGRKRMKSRDELACPGGKSQKTPRTMEDWRIVVKDRYPAYIPWKTYQANQGILADNRAEYMARKTRGTPREGELLLQGIAYCARCGHKMFVRYKGGGQYVCNHLRTQQGLPECQTVRAAAIDAAVGRAFLAAVAPAEIDALSRAHKLRKDVSTTARTAILQQIERKRYQAALAQRQYDKVDPDNRLVAAELERRWEAALIELREAEAEASNTLPASDAVLDRALRDKVVSLAGRLPALWDDPATGDARRKALLRCLVEKAVLERGTHDVVNVRLVWVGGAVSELAVPRRVNGIDDLAHGTQMRSRIFELAGQGLTDNVIAAQLTREGHRSPSCPERVLPTTVQGVRLGAGIKITRQRTRWPLEPGRLGVTALAERLGIPPKWLYVQIRQGRITIDRRANGAYLFDDTPHTIEALRNLRSRAVECIDLRAHQHDTEGHRHG